MAREARASIGREGFVTRVLVGEHALVADEPPEVGGGDTGPTPVEMLLGSLVACKAITARMYADRKGWAVERIESVARVASAAGHTIEGIEVEMRFEGELTSEQRERLLGIAEKCPVQKALVGGVWLESGLVE